MEPIIFYRKKINRVSVFFNQEKNDCPLQKNDKFRDQLCRLRIQEDC